MTESKSRMYLDGRAYVPEPDYDDLAARLAECEARWHGAVSEGQALQARLAEAERDHEQTMAERDHNEEMADKLAAAIATLTGVDIGEHSSVNCPWLAALEAAEEHGPTASALIVHRCKPFSEIDDPQVSICEPIEELEVSNEALEFLRRATDGRHRIVSTGDLHEMQIAEARADGRMYVEPGGGLGWVLLPWGLTTSKDKEREQRLTDSATVAQDSHHE